MKYPDPTALVRRSDQRRIAETTRETERSVRLGDRGRPAGPRNALGATWVKSPGGGIAAGATVLCYIYNSDNTLSADQLAVFNNWPDNCPGNKKVAVIAGVPFWSCANGPG